MLSSLPNYSAVSVHNPPDYSLLEKNRSSSPPPPYDDSIGSSVTNHPQVAGNQPAQVQIHYDKQCIIGWCILIWITSLILLALLHIVLSFISIKCTLPETSLSSIRVLFVCHMFFVVGIISYCRYKRKLSNQFTLNDGFIATIFCLIVPTVMNVLLFMKYTRPQMAALNDAIQCPSSVTDTYPCRLLFYKLFFVLAIVNYMEAVTCTIITLIWILNYCSMRRLHWCLQRN
jgi:hypothetical protein